MGHVSKDENITPENREFSIGGAVVYSAITAKRLGANVLALTKLNENDRSALEIFSKHDVPYVYRPSRQTTSIRNTYFTPDREKRTCEAISVADPFKLSDIPNGVEATIIYLGGLMKGEFPTRLIKALSPYGRIAADAQGFIRVNENGQMIFKDWKQKRNLLPYITFFKTDAAEAEILTGEKDAEAAARILFDWGPHEVMVTSPSGVLVYAKLEVYRYPFTSKNLSGRTGRGDTCFAAYCSCRFKTSPEQACLYAAALTSLKMETPGPFCGTMEDVVTVIDERYAEYKPSGISGRYYLPS
jgi:sugar/nucleoside kinase (ribokinase family)